MADQCVEAGSPDSELSVCSCLVAGITGTIRDRQNNFLQTLTHLHGAGGQTPLTALIYRAAQNDKTFCRGTA